MAETFYSDHGSDISPRIQLQIGFNHPKGFQNDLGYPMLVMGVLIGSLTECWPLPVNMATTLLPVY